MINSKNYTTFLIPFFVICCSLYHIMYWGIFGINGLELVSITNLIKSTVQPILISSVGTFIGLFVANLILNKPGKSAQTDHPKRVTAWSVIIFLVSLSLPILYIIFAPSNTSTSLAASFLIVNIVYIFMDIDWVFDPEYKPKLDKRFLLMFMLYFPCITLIQARDNALNIYNNKEYFYSTKFNNTHLSDTLKFLGKPDDVFIFSTKDNKEILYIKADTITMMKK